MTRHLIIFIEPKMNHGNVTSYATSYSYQLVLSTVQKLDPDAIIKRHENSSYMMDVESEFDFNDLNTSYTYKLPIVIHSIDVKIRDVEKDIIIKNFTIKTKKTK